MKFLRKLLVVNMRVAKRAIFHRHRIVSSSSSSSMAQVSLLHYHHRRHASGRAIIIGAGPTGTSTALSLQSQGIDCMIFERLPQKTDQDRLNTMRGRSLMIHGGGLCFKYLGISDEFESIGSKQCGIYVTDGKDNELLNISSDYMDDAIKKQNLNPKLIRRVIRDELYDLLINECIRRSNENPNGAQITVHFNKYITSIEETTTTDLTDTSNNNSDSTEITAHFEDGSKVTGDILIGCDGINSTVREMYFTAKTGKQYLEVADLVGWYAVDKIDSLKETGLYEQIIGTSFPNNINNNHNNTHNNTQPDELLTKFQLNDSSLAHLNIFQNTGYYTFWIGCHRDYINDKIKNREISYLDPDAILTDDDTSNIVRGRESYDIEDWEANYKIMKYLIAEKGFDGNLNYFADICKDSIRKLDIATVEFDPNEDKWHNNKILLLGDASHGISRFGGQGVNQGIYDAIALGNIVKEMDLDLKDDSQVNVAFDELQVIRSVQTTDMINHSKVLHKLHFAGENYHFLRNFALDRWWQYGGFDKELKRLVSPSVGFDIQLALETQENGEDSTENSENSENSENDSENGGNDSGSDGASSGNK